MVLSHAAKAHLQGRRGHRGVFADADELLHDYVCNVEAESGRGVDIAGSQDLLQQELAACCCGCGTPAIWHTNY